MPRPARSRSSGVEIAPTDFGDGLSVWIDKYATYADDIHLVIEPLLSSSPPKRLAADLTTLVDYWHGSDEHRGEFTPFVRLLARDVVSGVADPECLNTGRLDRASEQDMTNVLAQLFSDDISAEDARRLVAAWDR